MKCEIVEDLLPLYIDDVCNKETKALVEEHLKTCSKCNELFKNMSEGVPKDETLDEINSNIKEKDLLLKAKENIKIEFTKKILKKIFKLVIILSILIIIGLFPLITITNHLEYPRFFFDSLSIKAYISLFVTFISPLIISIVGILIEKSKYYIKFCKLKNIIILIFLIIGISLSTINGLIIYYIPPIESYTNNYDNYLKTSSDMDKYEDVYKEFFPEKIPDDAANINYVYRKYYALFETSFEISASWILPESSYEHYKQLVENKFTLNLIENNEYEVEIKNNRLSPFKLLFKYNDDTNEINYKAIFEED
ncbi:MAG: zf-HC2 domain-containing protein [Candidatus Metalachnospira sp.]|nr:zf-HC2 domain-containing protein [Candidatus Metalachnospira sp.]